MAANEAILQTTAMCTLYKCIQPGRWLIELPHCYQLLGELRALIAAICHGHPCRSSERWRAPALLAWLLLPCREDVVLAAEFANAARPWSDYGKPTESG